MSLTIPLAVRMSTSKGDVHVTRDVHDLTFRSTVPGGYASATFTLSRPLALQPREIVEFGKVYIYDRRNGETVWEGRLEDSGRSAGDSGEIYQITATGPAAHALDRTISLVYVDQRLDAWEQGAQSTTSINITKTDNEVIYMTIPSGVTIGAGLAGLIVYHGLAYSGQEVARVNVSTIAGFASGNFEWRLGTSLGTGATVNVDTDAVTLGPNPLDGAVGGMANVITSGHDTVRLRLARIVSNFTAVDESIWTEFDPVVRGLIMDETGTDITTYTTDTIRAHEVVADLLGRLLPHYDGPNATIDTTTVNIDQLAYVDGASAQKVLEDLMAIEPAYYWAAWESGDNGRYRFEWTTWPDAVRYEVSVADGFDSPASAGEIYNAVSVRWRTAVGAIKTVRLTQTVDILDDVGLTREYHIDLSDEIGSENMASQVGAEFLSQHQMAENRGTLTIARPIVDHETGRRVMPWEIKPGKLIRVRNVLPRIDALNATGRDGVTVFKIASVEFNAGSVSATLELDGYSMTVARAVADLNKNRITRKR